MLIKPEKLLRETGLLQLVLLGVVRVNLHLNGAMNKGLSDWRKCLDSR